MTVAKRQKRSKLGLCKFWQNYFGILWQHLNETVQNNDNEMAYFRLMLKRQFEIWQRKIHIQRITLAKTEERYWRGLQWMNEKNAHWQRIFSSLQFIANLLKQRNISTSSFLLIPQPSVQLWTFRQQGRIQKLKISFAFLAADTTWWKNFLNLILAQAYDEAKIMTRTFSNNTAFQDVHYYIHRIAHAPVGNTYNLESIFYELNKTYFENKLTMPTLTWSTRRSQRKLGSYLFKHNVITISKALDDKNIDILVVSFVLYHEILHMVHGVHQQNGRQYTHTPAFKRDEKRFAFYHQATKLLESLDFSNNDCNYSDLDEKK